MGRISFAAGSVFFRNSESRVRIFYKLRKYLSEGREAKIFTFDDEGTDLNFNRTSLESTHQRKRIIRFYCTWICGYVGTNRRRRKNFPLPSEFVPSFPKKRSQPAASSRAPNEISPNSELFGGGSTGHYFFVAAACCAAGLRVAGRGRAPQETKRELNSARCWDLPHHHAYNKFFGYILILFNKSTGNIH